MRSRLVGAEVGASPAFVEPPAVVQAAVLGWVDVEGHGRLAFSSSNQSLSVSLPMENALHTDTLDLPS